MKKGLYFLVSSAVVLSAFAAVVISHKAKNDAQMIKTDADVYTLTLNSSNTLATGTGVATVRNNSGYGIDFEYDHFTLVENQFGKLSNQGHIANVGPIHAMQSLTAIFSGSGLTISYGFAMPSDYQGEQPMMMVNDESLTSGVAYTFDGELPAYFALWVSSEDVTIESIVVKYTCSDVDNKDLEDEEYLAPLCNENYAKINAGYVCYWASKSDWGGPEVDATVRAQNLDYQVHGGDWGWSVSGTNEGNANWGFQVFYKNTLLTAGLTYKLSFDLLADDPCSFSLNSQTINATTTNEHYEIVYVEQANELSFKAIIATHIGDSNGLHFSNIAWTVMLDTPSNVLLSNTNVLTFNSDVNATSHEAKFVDALLNDVAGCDPFVVSSGDNISSEIPGALADGVYYVLVRSKKGDTYSSWSAPSAVYYVNAESQIRNADVAEEAVNGDNAVSIAAANHDKFVEWHDQGWCNSNVSLVKNEHLNKNYTISYSATGACDFGVQLFYKNSALTAGNNYRLTLNISSVVALTIKMENGASVNSVHVNAGETTALYLDYTEAANLSSMKIVIPVAEHSNSITLSNIVWTAR